MSIVLAVILVLVVGIGFLVFFIVKSLVLPQRVEALAALVKKGKTQTVIRAAKAIIARDSRSAEAHYWLGMAYHRDNRDELAIMEFKAVNQLGISGKSIPEVEFRELLAQLFINQKQGEEALKEYLLLIKLMPNHAEYYYRAGKLFTERNRTDMAENYLRKAAELSPKDGRIHYELGIMLYRDKKASEAKAALQVALKYPGENAAHIYFYLGKIQKDSRDYTGAAASFEKAARDAEFRIRALVERGGCYMSLNAVEKAIPDLERAVKAITDESSQDSLYARYFLGLCYENTRQLDKAIAQWDKIYSRKKNFRDVGEKLAQYQELRSDDNMKDYMTAAPVDFVELCKTIVNQTMELQVQNTKNISEGCEITAIENDSAKWRNVRKMPRLIRFLRSPDPVDDSKVRAILDDAKAANLTKSALVSCSDFTRTAVEYATSRPVELYNREKLQELLGRAASSAPSRPPRRA
ncbi:MAG: tetratricopeptide repeat protein [Treponema sp.]|jgi:tetratricopeptide (TPR) repeat protein|nr:tetratricopeptide repeat protein [Treponema sp.]